MKNLGEEINEVTLVEKVLRSLSTKFESKVSAIEEKKDLQTITMNTSTSTKSYLDTAKRSE